MIVSFSQLISDFFSTLFSKIKVENNVFWKLYLINDTFEYGGTLQVFLSTEFV